jgi:hypothetical protein
MCWIFKKLFGKAGGTPPLQPTGPDDRLLLRAINKYPAAPLQGCVNDALDVKAWLVGKKKFKESSVRVLLDEQATTAAVLDACRWLAKTPAGAVAYYHNSGHGVQVPVASGETGEADGLSEADCPYDFDWSPKHMITDKDYYKIFWEMDDNVKFYWTSDSCHSGDLDRRIGMSRPRAMPLPQHVAIQVWKLKARMKGLKARRLVEREQAKILDVGFVSACRSEQTAADAFIDNRPCGAFTHYFLKALNEGDSLPLAKVVANTLAYLRVNGYDQEPQAEGPRVSNSFLT